jgi:hypothetical protein
MAPARWAAAQETPRPNDATPPVLLPEPGDSEERENGVERDDPTARLDWQRGAWGIVTPAFRANALKEARGHNTRKNAPGPKWVNIGPFGCDYEQNGSFTGHVGDSGRARTILPHPTNPDIVYFLTSGGGLWRTNNWTSPNTTWTPLTDDLPTTGGGGVAFGRNPNTLYLGMGDPYDQILVGGAMVKSKDGGMDWSPMIELGNAVSVRDVKVDVSTNRDIVLVATDSGLYRSADEGETYGSVAAFAGMSVWSIQRTSAGWLVSAQPCPAAAAGLRCGLATTLFLSTDRGATWAPISNAGNVFSLNGRTTLAVGQPGDSVVYAYAAAQNDGAMRDVYRSSDGGQTWVANGVNATKIPTNPVASSMPNMNICHGQCWYDQSILVDPRDSNRNTVWIGGDLGVAKTTDGGGTWTIQTWWLYSQVPTLPYAHADHHANAFKATGTPTLIFGDDGGLNISTDDGVTFSSEKNRGLATHLYYSVAGNPKFPNFVIGGLQDNGTRVRRDNGGTHDQIIGGDGMGAAASQANTAVVLGSSQGSGIRMDFSSNPPFAFQNAVSRGGLSDSAGAGFFTAIIPAPASLDPTGKVFFHFTNSRVFRTNDGGLTFSIIGSATAPVSPGLPSTRRFRSSPYDLGVCPTDLARIAVGAAGGFLDVTTNGGASWTDIDLIAAVPGYQGFVTNVTWQDAQTLWVTAVAQPAGALRVLKGTIATPASPWSSATWTAMQNGLPDLPVTRVYFDPRDASRNTIYAATHVGIYRTTDGGANWAPFGNGLPTVRVNDIYMPPDGSFMRIATYGRGVWEMAQLELADAKLDDSAASCDADGILDNGESGNLTITLHNQGPNNVNHVTLTVTSSNPHVTFPNGNVVAFPPVQKDDVSTGSISVALSGASGIESSDFQIAIDSPELGVGAFNVISTQRLNYDEQPQGSATETVESANHGWTITGSMTTAPNIHAWQRRALSPTQFVWWGPDNNGQTDGVKGNLPDEQILTSPVMHVGSGPLIITFSHRFAFEATGWDGGVIEITTNGGATWSDIGVGSYNGATNAVTNAPIGTNHPAFVNRMIGWPNFATVTRNLGTTYAGQDVQIRFRVGADDSTGAPGWEIDNIAVSGITNTPFTALVPQTGICP